MFLSLRLMYRYMVRTCFSEKGIFDMVQGLKRPLPENILRCLPLGNSTSLYLANRPHLKYMEELRILIICNFLAFCAVHGIFLDCLL